MNLITITYPYNYNLRLIPASEGSPLNPSLSDGRGWGIGPTPDVLATTCAAMALREVGASPDPPAED